ncbi:MAG: copper transport protein, partial [Thermomicrobiales bacterium]|nr:copper transport protein [Thermomicrobiales bacterium]
MLLPRRLLLLGFVIALPVAFVLVSARPVAAHANILRADPPLDGILAAPPRWIDLWLSEPIAAGEGSPALRLLDQAGRDLEVADVRVDPADATHVRATVRDVGTGTFTVVWSNRSATDGHALSGSYAFRVVSSTRAPGAATTEGDTPAVWAVATRWLTFLGAALVAGGFGLARFVLPGGAGQTGYRRRSALIAAGAAVGLAASLAEPVLQTRWPPAGALAPTLADAIRALPRAWWIRPAALVLSLLVVVILPRLPRRGERGAPAGEALGMAIGLAAILGLSLTSHAAGRADWRALAVASNVLHQWAVALWVGGLAALALWWAGRGAALDAAPVRRFSRIALWLAAVGIGTGVLNAGLVLPRLRALWSSTYGEVVLLKVAVLVPVLVLATFHRAALRRAADRLGAVMRRTVRLEAALVLV